MVDCLCPYRKSWAPSQHCMKLGTTLHVCRGGEFQVQGHVQLHKEFQITLGYMTPCLKQEINTCLKEAGCF